MEKDDEFKGEKKPGSFFFKPGFCFKTLSFFTGPTILQVPGSHGRYMFSNHMVDLIISIGSFCCGQNPQFLAGQSPGVCLLNHHDCW